jgi:hypothetical protein
MLVLLEGRNMPEIKPGQLINLAFCNCKYVKWKTHRKMNNSSMTVTKIYIYN